MTRQELYDLVWQEPVTKVAKRFGISDVAVRKTCVTAPRLLGKIGAWEARGTSLTIRARAKIRSSFSYDQNDGADPYGSSRGFGHSSRR